MSTEIILNETMKLFLRNPESFKTITRTARTTEWMSYLQGSQRPLNKIDLNNLGT